MRLLERLWRDKRGGINSAELILLATILVIGLVPGIATLRDALLTELADIASAISGLDSTVQIDPLQAGPQGGESGISVAADAFN